MAATARILTVAVVEERPVLRAVDPGVLAEHKQLEALGERLVVPTAPQVLSTRVVEVMTMAVAEVVATTAAEVPETTVVAAVARVTSAEREYLVRRPLPAAAGLLALLHRRTPVFRRFLATRQLVRLSRQPLAHGRRLVRSLGSGSFRRTA